MSTALCSPEVLFESSRANNLSLSVVDGSNVTLSLFRCCHLGPQAIQTAPPFVPEDLVLSLNILLMLNHFKINLLMLNQNLASSRH